MSELSPRQLDALDRIQQKSALQPFFFRKLKGLKWFDELEKRGFFKPQLNPRPVESDEEGYFTIPTWPILDYLDQTASELQQNEKYVDRYLQVIRDVSKYSIVEGFSNYRTSWRFARMFRVIPLSKINNNDINLFKFWLSDNFDRSLVGAELGEQLLPRLLIEDSDHARDLAIGLIEVLTILTWQPRQWGEPEEIVARLPIDDYHSEKIFSDHAHLIGESLELDGINIFRGRILELLEKSSKDQYSYIWRPAIEDHKQNIRKESVENILISAFRDGLLGFIERRAAAATSYIEELLASEIAVFHRVAIYVLGEYHRQLGGLLHKLVDPKFFNYHYQHEMYHFLRACFTGYEEETQEDVFRIIGDVAKQNMDSDQPEDIQVKQEAYAWLRWLSAIKGLGNQKADNLYAEKRNVAESEPDHPDFASYMEGGWVGDSSPYSTEELLSRDFEDLIEILKSFKEDGGWKTPTRRGLSLALKAALKLKPKFFKGNLGSFVTLDFDYSYQLLQGYKDLWKEDQYDNWAELFDFCWALLNVQDFWERECEKQAGTMTASPSWIVSTIGELIRAGTADDKRAFDPVMLPKARQIIEHILNNQKGESFATERDAVSISINSPRGKCIEALFNYALRRCRLKDREENGHKELWARKLQPIFDNQIDLVQEGNYEFVTLFTNHLPNLLYLNHAWTMTQLLTIFEKEDRLRWLCAYQGYSYVSQIYSEVYKFLRENSHLRDGLTAEDLDSRVKNRIIQNIVIAYLQGDEQLNDEGIFIWLIERWKLEELRELTWFVWTLRGDQREDIAAKLLPLWGELSSHADQNTEAGRRVLSKLCMWSVFVDELSEQTMGLLMQAAPFADLEHDSYILIKELKRLVDVYPDQVADIYLRVLDGFAPTYQQEFIEYVLTRLYENGGGLRQKANRICDKYVEYGVKFPSDIRARFAQG